jgi:hypothetical protein
MKPVKQKFQIKDKLAGFVYMVIAQNKTHLLTIDQMKKTVLVNKTQAEVI